MIWLKFELLFLSQQIPLHPAFHSPFFVLVLVRVVSIAVFFLSFFTQQTVWAYRHTPCFATGVWHASKGLSLI